MRTPKDEDTIFPRTKILIPKSAYIPFSAHITSKNFLPSYTFGSLLQGAATW